MVFVGLSGEGHGRWSLGYDVFLGDGETFEPATSLFTHMGHTAISKSGNRVAFLADDTRRQDWSLWVLDVETGRVWETSLKRRLQEWHRSSIRGSAATRDRQRESRQVNRRRVEFGQGTARCALCGTGPGCDYRGKIIEFPEYTQCRVRGRWPLEATLCFLSADEVIHGVIS